MYVCLQGCSKQILLKEKGFVNVCLFTWVFKADTVERERFC